MGRLGTIFSISMAMACASNMPMMIGSRRLPATSPSTKAKEPACDWLEERPNISSSILSTKCIWSKTNETFYYWEALMAFVSLGTTSKASPTTP